MNDSTIHPFAVKSPLFEIGHIVDELADVRKHWRHMHHRSTEPGGRELPSPEALKKIMDDLRAVLFPMRLGPPELRQETENFFVGHTLDVRTVPMVRAGYFR